MPEPVSSLLHGAAERWPDRVAIVDRAESGRRVLTTAELDGAARRAAARLRAAGVGRGDRVALAAENGAALAAAWFGIVYAGAAVIPIAVTSAAAEMAQRLAHARCRAAVFDRAREALARQSAALSGEPVSLLCTDDLDGDPADGSPARPHDDAPAMILYTSGTTGEARAAVISHRALVRHTRAIAARALRLDGDDRILGVLPLSHSYGCRMVMLTALVSGSAVVLLPRFHAAASIDTAIAEDVSWIPAVPTMFAAWGALAPGPRPPRLRWCLSAGAPLADEVRRRAEARLGAEVRQGYGMTEATFCTINAPPDERVSGSVGLPAPGVEFRVVERGDLSPRPVGQSPTGPHSPGAPFVRAAGSSQSSGAGDLSPRPVGQSPTGPHSPGAPFEGAASQEDRDLPVGEVGEVLVRGDNLMSGYLDDPAATALALRGGWMHTGDLGFRDESGRLHVVDRLKDLIIRGGNNVYPAEVEAALARHAGVEEVAVIGRPDAYYGEEVIAVIVPRGTRASATELRDWTAKLVGSVKVPREYAFLDALPLGPSRKVLKRTLRDWVVSGQLATEKPERS